ncbi:coactosin-like protein isoform X1 [Bolinopsis microptera]|uniref:coactosin-like protein isoform X1 n=1 Tax=Bolinopsis microptera TaxID=2820187 RepID=UPI00307AF42C
MPKGVIVDEEAVMAGYADVRDDESETKFLMLTYQDENTKIGVSKSGADYSEVLTDLGGEEGESLRAYVYLRVVTGDEMSKRHKFVLLTWCGPSVPALKKAKMSLEKTLVKNLMRSFAVEIQASELEEMALDNIMDLVRKSGGANYGPGK